MKKIFFIFTAFFLIVSGFAQEKQYTMQDAVIGNYTNLAPENINQIDWIPGENAFYRISASSKNILEKVEVPKMKITQLFTLADINRQLYGEQRLRQFPLLHWLDSQTLYFDIRDTLYTGKNQQGKWRFSKWVGMPAGTDNYYVEPHQQQVAFSVHNNLSYADADGNIQKVTDHSDENIVSGQIVSRNEFGVNDGLYFSPQGNYIAFYQKDESKVANYPVIDWAVVPAKNHDVKYPMAGGESEKVSMGVYNPKTRQTVWMKVDKAYDDYLTNVSWGPQEKYLYIATLKRNQKQLTLNKYDIKTGEKVAEILKEEDPKYVHPAEPLSFIPGHPDEFIWWSERDGYQQLYRYNTQGKLLNKITDGKWVVNAIDGWNTKNNEVIISAAKRSPMDKTVYAVNWKTGKIRSLEDTPGMHTAKVNPAGNYWIDQYSNYTTPNHISVKAVKGKWNKDLLEAKNPLKDYQQPQIKELTITAADGKTPLYARMILPPNFDAHKKYPVVVYLYNGPGIQLLHHSFPESGNLWYDYMAQHGYIIFTMDGRGSSNRGLDFEQVTHRHLGVEEMKDQMEGVKYLKSLPYVDADRLGVHGWSFGGFMTVSLMLNYPDTFKVAVAGGPVIDWNMYEVMYTERYMDTPQNNPEGYKNTSLLHNKVKNLKGKLLIIHGAQDSTVVWQQSMRFIRESVKNRKQVDYYVYPAYPHNVRGFDRIHLMQKITDYFDDFLKQKQ